MKNFKTTKRTQGVKNVTDNNGSYLYQVWNTVEVNGEVTNVYVFIAEHPPVKPTEYILNAIKKAFDENGSVTYNCGDGNQTFTFSEKEPVYTKYFHELTDAEIKQVVEFLKKGESQFGIEALQSKSNPYGVEMKYTFVNGKVLKAEFYNYPTYETMNSPEPMRYPEHEGGRHAIDKKRLQEFIGANGGIE